MVVGDRRPYISCLVTLDAEMLAEWKAEHGKPVSAELPDLSDDPDLISEVQAAVDAANEAVSQAESIRRFAILGVDFTESSGQLTPTLKLRRDIVAREFADKIEELYR